MNDLSKMYQVYVNKELQVKKNEIKFTINHAPWYDKEKFELRFLNEVILIKLRKKGQILCWQNTFYVKLPCPEAISFLFTKCQKYNILGHIKNKRRLSYD